MTYSTLGLRPFLLFTGAPGVFPLLLPFLPQPLLFCQFLRRKSDVRSCDLGIVNSLPWSLGAFSNSTPDGEYDYRRRYDYEYQERNQSLHCPGGLHHERAGGKAKSLSGVPTVPRTLAQTVRCVPHSRQSRPALCGAPASPTSPTNCAGNPCASRRR